MAAAASSSDVKYVPSEKELDFVGRDGRQFASRKELILTGREAIADARKYVVAAAERRLFIVEFINAMNDEKKSSTVGGSIIDALNVAKEKFPYAKYDETTQAELVLMDAYIAECDRMAANAPNAAEADFDEQIKRLKKLSALCSSS